MTDLRRSVDTTARYHQTSHTAQHSHDTYRSSCSSTPEPKPPLNLCKSLSNGSSSYTKRHPLLQSLSDHSHMNSASGGSSSTTSTTATATTIGRSSQYISESANPNSSMGEIQFDEREIYYVSPTKRKSSLSASQTPVLRSSLRACERLRSFSPTSVAAIAPSYPPIMPSPAYGARLSGTIGQDLSFDNYEASSHYSDTAMQVLRSGSCSAMTSTMLTSNNLINNPSASSSSNNTAATAGVNDSSSNSNSNHVVQQRSQNNVTFSNHITEQHAHTPQQSHRGSLRRSKGRSNQSLCSCDAGSDAELNPDPTRPLYEYSLERRRKVHTYTCEQNAQILLRLERERNRRLSLSGGSIGGVGSSKDDIESVSGEEGEEMCMQKRLNIVGNLTSKIGSNDNMLSDVKFKVASFGDYIKFWIFNNNYCNDTDACADYDADAADAIDVSNDNVPRCSIDVGLIDVTYVHNALVE
ncbi:uncharacterized protein LOC142225126 [Haematobia irritans]|uniref:uncharacterized protein LOC142225126 n=1 Tax=Haematobia irritans TaxID=7368 RepID=UPI003F4F4469